MSQSESKLKRSPYLSQMTRTADIDLTTAATLSGPRGTSANGLDGAAEGGVARDFFELKRPEISQPSAGRQQQHRPSLKKPNSTNTKTATSVTFSADLVNRSSPVSQDSLHDTASNAVVSKQQEQIQHPSAPPKSIRSNSTTPNLQYYYNAKLKSSAVSLDLIKNKTMASSSQSMTFRDVLDEGDGKEGDLNLRQRNEQWKSFSAASLAEDDEVSTASSESRKKRKYPLPYSRGGWVSANDLVLMRRAASRMKMCTSLDEFVSLSKSNSCKVDLLHGNGDTLGSAMLSRIAQDLNETSPNVLFMSSSARMSNAPLISESTRPASAAGLGQFSLMRRVHTISAGLAYGSDNFRLLNECKNILEV